VARLPDHEAFSVSDVVQTDFSGKLTRHRIVGRYKVRNSQTGICYRVAPKIPKSGPGLIDHGWFEKVSL
jgi:hypothetical protein